MVYYTLYTGPWHRDCYTCTRGEHPWGASWPRDGQLAAVDPVKPLSRRGPAGRGCLSAPPLSASLRRGVYIGPGGPIYLNLPTNVSDHRSGGGLGSPREYQLSESNYIGKQWGSGWNCPGWSDTAFPPGGVPSRRLPTLTLQSHRGRYPGVPRAIIPGVSRGPGRSALPETVGVPGVLDLPKPTRTRQTPIWFL